MRVLNRKQTLAEIAIKKRQRKRSKDQIIRYRDWVYSYGIGRTKIIKGSMLDLPRQL